MSADRLKRDFGLSSPPEHIVHEIHNLFELHFGPCAFLEAEARDFANLMDKHTNGYAMAHLQEQFERLKQGTPRVESALSELDVALLRIADKVQRVNSLALPQQNGKIGTSWAVLSNTLVEGEEAAMRAIAAEQAVARSKVDQACEQRKKEING